MNIKEEIDKLKEIQNFTGGYTEVAIENIKMAPFLFLDHIKRADMLLNQDEIRVYLVGATGVKAWFYRIFKKTQINHNLNLLAKYIYFWVPKSTVMPKINFYWGPIPDDHE